MQDAQSRISIGVDRPRVYYRFLAQDFQMHLASPLRGGKKDKCGFRENLMNPKNIIFTVLAIGALSASANGQMANSMGTISKPGMKASTSHTAAMPPKSAATSDAMMDMKSDEMKGKKMSHSRHHHHRMHHHHHRMMHHKM